MSDNLNIFSRTELILGEKGMEKLSKSHVAIFGIGGVGSFTAEALARSGIGEMTLIDADLIELTNINRQLYALHSTLGKAKTDIAAERIKDINPKCHVNPLKIFYTGNEIDLSGFDYVVDAIDTISSKLALAENADKVDVPLIACMGVGNRLDITKLDFSDIYKTSVCPLAKVMRYELRKRGIKHLKVLYSTEKPALHLAESSEITPKRKTIGSVSFVPPAAGLMLAGEVIKSLSGF